MSGGLLHLNCVPERDFLSLFHRLACLVILT
jgi:hypothetical protein